MYISKGIAVKIMKLSLFYFFDAEIIEVTIKSFFVNSSRFTLIFKICA